MPPFDEPVVPNFDRPADASGAVLPPGFDPDLGIPLPELTPPRPRTRFDPEGQGPRDGMSFSENVSGALRGGTIEGALDEAETLRIARGDTPMRETLAWDQGAGLTDEWTPEKLEVARRIARDAAFDQLAYDLAPTSITPRSIAGSLLGGVTAPSNLLSFGGPLIGRTLGVFGAGRVAQTAASTATAAGVTDVATQGIRLGSGAQDEFHVEEAVLAPIVGGLLGAGGHVAGDAIGKGAGSVARFVRERSERRAAASAPRESLPTEGTLISEPTIVRPEINAAPALADIDAAGLPISRAETVEPPSATGTEIPLDLTTEAPAMTPAAIVVDPDAAAARAAVDAPEPEVAARPATELPSRPPTPDMLDLAMSGRLSGEKAERIAQELQVGNRTDEDAILGDRADAWRRAHRAQNSYDDAVAQRAGETIDEIERGLPKADVDRLYGIGTDFVDPREWRQLASKLTDVEISREDAVSVIATEFRNLPAGNDWQALSSAEREAVVVTLHAMNREVARGGDPKALLQDAFQERFGRYGAGGDAAELVRGQMERLSTLLHEGIQSESTAAPAPLAPSLAALPAPSDRPRLLARRVPGLPPHRVTTAAGRSVEVAPVVVEARDLIASADNGYNVDLQPRQRDRAASQQQIREIARGLDPERLGYASEADRGAPIVGDDGMVESGNGRVLALRQAYAQDGEAAARYRAWLRDQGVDVAAFDEPVLVRQRLTPLSAEERRTFAVEANQASTLAISATERAVADARLISPEMLDQVRNPSDLGALANLEFRKVFVRALPASEHGAMVGADGALSSEGLARIRNAVLARAYDNAGVLSRIAESTTDDVRSISNAFVASAPEWAKLRADIGGGTVRADMDLTGELLEAVARTADLRAKGLKLDTFLAQQDAFDRLPRSVEAFMRMFFDEKGRRAAGAPAVAERLRFYASEARKVLASRGLDLGLPPVSAADLQASAGRRAQRAASGEPALLFDRRRRPDPRQAPFFDMVADGLRIAKPDGRSRRTRDAAAFLKALGKDMSERAGRETEASPRTVLDRVRAELAEATTSVEPSNDLAAALDAEIAAARSRTASPASDGSFLAQLARDLEAATVPTRGAAPASEPRFATRAEAEAHVQAEAREIGRALFAKAGDDDPVAALERALAENVSEAPQPAPSSAEPYRSPLTPAPQPVQVPSPVEERVLRVVNETQGSWHNAKIWDVRERLSDLPEAEFKEAMFSLQRKGLALLSQYSDPKSYRGKVGIDLGGGDARHLIGVRPDGKRFLEGRAEALPDTLYRGKRQPASAEPDQVRQGRSVEDQGTEPVPGDMRPARLEELAQSLAADFEGVLRTGRVQPGARGQYGVRSGVSRVRSLADLDTVVHEVGHGLHQSPANRPILDPLERAVFIRKRILS